MLQFLFENIKQQQPSESELSNKTISHLSVVTANGNLATYGRVPIDFSETETPDNTQIVLWQDGGEFFFDTWGG